MKYKSLWELKAFARPLMKIFVFGFLVMVLNGFLEMRVMWETQKVFRPLFVELQKYVGGSEESPREAGRRIGEQVGADQAGRAGEKIGAQVGAQTVQRYVQEQQEKSRRQQPDNAWKTLLARLGVAPQQADPSPVSRTKEQALSALLRATGILFGFFMAAAIATSMSFYIGEYISQRLLLSLRAAVFDHLQALSLSFFERHRTGELISRINNDTMVLQRIMGPNLGRLVVAPFAIVFSVLAMLLISPTLTLLTALIIPTVLLASGSLGRKVRTYARLVQEKFADLTAIIDETFLGIRVIKIFGMERLTQERFDDKNISVLKNEMRANRMRALNVILVGALTGGAVCTSLLAGAREIANGAADAAGLMGFILLMQTAASRLAYLSRTNLQLQQAEAAAARTLELLAVKPELLQAANPVPLDHVGGAISFCGVTFAYEDTPVLHDVNLDIAAGEVVALVGPSGAGKTTIANLVARLYDADKGAVAIDGVDVRDMTFEALKTNMGIVPQETILFSASAKENISFGRPGAGDEEVFAAARAANAHDFISGLPEGYDTQVGERGAKLSGGQKQRIAIARALLRDPAILILDEATSSLDNESEAAIHRALQTLIKGRTTIIIAHRLSTIQNADRIIVLDRGRIIEQGKHDDLMSQGGLYRSLYESGHLGAEQSEATQQ